MQDLVKKLCKELNIEKKEISKEKIFDLDINEKIKVSVKHLDPGLFFHSIIAPCPEKKREELFIYLMKANLLHQGTGESVIGLDKNEKNLTLSFEIPYELNYMGFKDKLEEFVNFVAVWQREIKRIKKEEMENPY